MIANVAFLAAITVFLMAAWVAGELTFLAAFKGAIFGRHGNLIAGAFVLLFFNLCAIYYSVGRWLFLRDAGRKLQHIDRQLTTPDAVLDDLRLHLKS
jgi:hypothetical protein